MERIEFLTMVGLIFLKVIGAVVGIMFVSYLSTLIYDEVQILRQKSPYEIWLAAMVGAEFIVYGRPKKPLVSVPSVKYHGRHREEDPFIHDLAVELRAMPGTLCYNKTMSFETAEEDQPCGVF
jgi:hypothetical protein